MELSLFDLHCDTAYEMERRGQALTQNRLAVSLTHAAAFRRYIQVMAIWTDRRLDDEAGWLHFFKVLEHLKADAALQSGKAVLSPCPCLDSETPQLLLGLEDARILSGKLSRVDDLYAVGVRILTPLWQGETCIGGSHDTTVGLTAFGRAALRRALSLGMIPDISHASEASAEEIFALAEEVGRPVIASHSNAYAVCDVSRNLRDGQVQKLLQADGLIGLNLYRRFLNCREEASMCDVFPHIEHFLALGASDALALGGDMDGCELPPDLSHLGELPRLADQMLAHNYPESLVRKIFFENAARFAACHLKA